MFRFDLKVVDRRFARIALDKNGPRGIDGSCRSASVLATFSLTTRPTLHASKRDRPCLM